MANMLSKMALSRCRRSLASQLRLSRVTRTWNHQRFWQPGVLRTQRPTRFLFAISRIRCAQRHNGNLLAVRAPDQQHHGTVRLMKSHILSRKVHHCPQCARSQHGRGHPLNPGHEESVHKGLDVSLATGSFVHHLNQFLSRDGKSQGHFLSEKRTLSTERQPRLHTSATTITKTDHDADIVWKLPVHRWK